MIVLGITPGLRSLAYCVLFVRPGGDEPELVDSDLLKGGSAVANDSEERLRKKARPHVLTLDVVLERAFDLNLKKPVVMAIGPGSPKKPEPPELVFFVRAFLTGLCVELREKGIEIQCLNWERQEDLDAILGLSAKRAVRRHLNKSATTLIRAPYVLAAGTALAALKKLGQLPVYV